MSSRKKMSVFFLKTVCFLYIRIHEQKLPDLKGLLHKKFLFLMTNT